MKKKHPKKLHKTSHRAVRRVASKENRPFFFAIFFASLMVAYGLVRILAATPAVSYSLTPASQTVSGGQTKTVAIQLAPNNHSINGGGVKITYDANRLTFSKFTAASSPYTLYNQNSAAGAYSFNYYSYGGSSQAVSLGTLEFKVKTVTAATQTSIAFTPANTTAYHGYNPSYYTVQLTNATMNLQAPPPPAKCALDSSLLKTDPKCTPCAYNGSIIASNPACKKPASITNPGTTGTGNPPAGTANTGGSAATSADGSETPADSTTPPANETIGEPSSDSSGTDNTADLYPIAVKKKSPAVPIAIVAGGIALLGGAIFAYLKRGKHGLPANTAPEALGAGLFDDSNVDDAAGSETDTTEAAEPTTQAETTRSDPDNQNPEPQAEDVDNDQPFASQEPTGQPPELADMEPVDTQPYVPPADVVAQAALAQLATQKPTAFEETLARDKAAAMPEPPKPDWQDKLPAKPAAAPEPEPKDMFDLAAEHPETYGSQQLAETESINGVQSKQVNPKGNSDDTA